MKIRGLNWLLALVAIICLSSCATDCNEELDTSNISIDAPYVPLHLEIRNITTAEDAIQFIDNHHLFTNYLLSSGMPKIQLGTSIYKLGTDEKLNDLLAEVNKQFPHFESQKAELDELFANISTFYPEFNVPTVYSMVSGYGGFTLEDGDSLLIVGLEYFMDSTAAYTPNRQEMPGYIKKYYTPQTITLKAAQAIAARYLAYDRSDRRLINEMIKFGKIIYFSKRVLPCKSEAEIMEYSEEELLGCYDNEFTVYSYFTRNELFFNSDREPLRLFVHQRPHTMELGEKSPGRLGQWLGYKIVNAYMENNDVSLQDLMSDTDHAQIFSQSGYKPRKP